MSEPTYTITITEAERTALAKTLGLLTTKLINAPIFVESPSGGTAAARDVLSPPQTPAAAAPVAPVIEQRDRWARDRKGKEVANPDGAQSGIVTIWKTEKKPPRKAGGKEFLKVTWQSKDRGYVDANCFDSALFPWLIKQTGESTTLWLVKSGEYLNIVGVRA